MYSFVVVLEDKPSLPPIKSLEQVSKYLTVLFVFVKVATEKLLVPDVCYDDFLKALTKSGSSVSEEELTRFVEWTEDFGQEG